MKAKESRAGGPGNGGSQDSKQNLVSEEPSKKSWEEQLEDWKRDAEAKLKVSPSPMSLDPCKAEKSFKKWNDSSPELPMEVESSTKPPPTLWR